MSVPLKTLGIVSCGPAGVQLFRMQRPIPADASRSYSGGDAPYRKSINEAILKMQEMGILHTLKERWWKQKHGGGQCTKDKLSDDAAATEMGLDNVGGVFLVLGVGVLLALLIAICEFLWNVRKVAVVQKLTPKQALIQELKFALDIWARQKAVNTGVTSRAISMENIDEKM